MVLRVAFEQQLDFLLGQRAGLACLRCQKATITETKK